MVTVDSSGLVALLLRSDTNHKRARSLVELESGSLVIPAGTLGETCYLLDREIGSRAVAALLTDIADGSFVLDCGVADLVRVRELVLRYADMPLGYADAAVIACAERRGGRVMTFDSRHFGVVAREGTIQILP